MPDFTQILVEKADGVATVTLNRPDKMNAFTRTMMDEIIAAMDDIDADDEALEAEEDDYRENHAPPPQKSTPQRV